MKLSGYFKNVDIKTNICHIQFLKSLSILEQDSLVSTSIRAPYYEYNYPYHINYFVLKIVIAETINFHEILIEALKLVVNCIIM